MRSSTLIDSLPLQIPEQYQNKQPFYDTTNQYFCLYDTVSHTKERLYTESEVKMMIDRHVLATKVLNGNPLSEKAQSMKQELIDVLTEYKVKLEELSAKYNSEL